MVKKALPIVDIDKLINKGAPLKEETLVEESKDIWTNINLRIPKEMLRNIDDTVLQSVGISRTGWILQAIDDKLRRNYESN